MKIEIVNELHRKLSPGLIKAIYKAAHNLDTNLVIINDAKWNWADIALFENNDCIDWNYYVNE